MNTQEEQESATLKRGYLRIDALYLEKGSGSSSYIQTGDTCYTTATGTGVVAAGYYKAFVSGGAGWMRITGTAGVVQSVGNC